MPPNAENLIWIDLEMTGLDTFNDVIIEIATIVTDKQLNILSEGPIIAIYQSNTRLEAMDEWNTQQHGQSGLTTRVQTSDYDVTYAEQQTLAFLQKYVPKGASPMCGNSICQDRRFMARLMPELEAYFHYRNLDVSSLKILVDLWKSEIAPGFSKKGSHLALDDIKDSINELRYYRQHLLK